MSGTELEEFLGPAPLPGQVPKRLAKSPVKKKSSSKWKETHENLIAVLRAARGVQPLPDTVAEATKHAGTKLSSINRNENYNNLWVIITFEHNMQQIFKCLSFFTQFIKHFVESRQKLNIN